MVKFVKCGGCGIEFDEEECVFATEIKAIDGKEYKFCCEHCAESYESDKEK